MEITLKANKLATTDTKGKTKMVLNPAGSVKVTVNYDIGTNLKEAVKLFGEDVVFSIFQSQAKVMVQNTVRTHLESGQLADTAQAHADTYKLGEKTARQAVDPMETIRKFINGMPEGAEKQSVLAHLGKEEPAEVEPAEVKATK